MAWEKSYEPVVGLPRNLRGMKTPVSEIAEVICPVIPDATSQNLGWAGKQSVCRWRDDLRWLGDDPLGWEWTYSWFFLSGNQILNTIDRMH
jgi:hypothetical protein